jgi:PIN domain nuclease of toxin-antitoxin system
VILLDTHIGSGGLLDRIDCKRKTAIFSNMAPTASSALSIISCWEVAKLVEYGRLKLDLIAT